MIMSLLHDVIGSRMVSTFLKYKAANSVPYIEQIKSFHEKVGLVTRRNLAIVLKIRSKLTAFFFGILEDSDLPPIIVQRSGNNQKVFHGF